MKTGSKIAFSLLALAGVLSPLEAASAVTLPAESVQLIENSKSLEISALSDLAYRLTFNSPAAADQIFASILSSREAWLDGEVVAILDAILNAIPDVRAVLAKVPAEVEKAVAVGVFDATVVNNEMAIALLHVIANSEELDDEQRQRLSPQISGHIIAAVDAAAINRLANGELSDGQSDAIDELTQAKRNPSSHEAVLEAYDDSTAGAGSPENGAGSPNNN